MFRRQQIFWQLQDVIRNNPVIGRPRAFLDWITRNHVNSIAIGIRRFTDQSDDSITLWRLLYSILENPGVITRSSHVRFYGKRLSGLGHTSFDNVVGRGKQILPQRMIRKDLREIEDGTARVRRFANKLVAHKTFSPRIRRALTYHEIDDAINVLDRIFCKYYLLLTAKGLSTAKATPQYDWMKVLRIPWIRKV